MGKVLIYFVLFCVAYNLFGCQAKEDVKKSKPNLPNIGQRIQQNPVQGVSSSSDQIEKSKKQKLVFNKDIEKDTWKRHESHRKEKDSDVGGKRNPFKSTREDILKNIDQKMGIKEPHLLKRQKGDQPSAPYWLCWIFYFLSFFISSGYSSGCSGYPGYPATTAMTTIKPIVPTNPTGPRFVCYYSNSARYRQGDGQFSIDNINPSLCTHYIYSFATLDGNTFKIQAGDPWGDITLGGYSSFVGLKKRNSNLKTMICIGGADEDGRKYSMMVSCTCYINAFVSSVVAFLQKYGFDGLDISWYSPTSAQDRDGFGVLLGALRSAFKPYGFLLSVMAVLDSRGGTYGYDIKKIGTSCDFVNLVAYWRPSYFVWTDYIAPLYRQPGEINNYCVDDQVQYYIDNGCPASKINLMFPLFGGSYLLSGSSTSPPGQCSGPAPGGPITNQPGMLSYTEVCMYIKNEGWILERESSNQKGCYAYSSSKPIRWVGFEDPVYARSKCSYVLSKGLGGACVFDISQDDFRNNCGGGAFPLLSAISSVLYAPPPVQPTPSPVTTPPKTKNARFVCYYSNDSPYRQGDGQFSVDNIDPYLCSHVIYCYATLSDSFQIQVGNVEADITNLGYSKFVGLKARNAGLKVMICIGGKGSSVSSKFSSLVASSTTINTFVISVIDFLRKYGFDGLDIAWYTPTTPGEKTGFANLLTVLRKSFNIYGFLLSVVALPDSSVVNSGYDLATMSIQCDFINLISYWQNPFQSYADYPAPIYRQPNEINSYSVDTTVQYYLNNGCSPAKINLVFPLSGGAWLLSGSSTSPPAQCSGPAPAGPFTGSPGTLSYCEICSKVRNNSWIKVRDSSNQRGCYAYSPNAYSSSNPIQWAGFDDPEYASAKCTYAFSKGLGGISVLDMGQDDFRNTCGDGKNPVMTAISRMVALQNN